MSDPAPVLRVGDYVQYDGEPWQVVAVSGVWLTLRGTSMRCCAVLLTQLVGAADFALLDGAAPAAPVVPAHLVIRTPHRIPAMTWNRARWSSGLRRR